MLANKGHSCVPAGASRRGPQDWNSSEIIPPHPRLPKNRGICAISPPGVNFTCTRAKNLLVPIEIQNNFPPSSSVKGDLRQYKHCLKCYWHWREEGVGRCRGEGPFYTARCFLSTVYYLLHCHHCSFIVFELLKSVSYWDKTKTLIVWDQVKTKTREYCS